MVDDTFNLTEVEKKPCRTFRKKSKYDSIIDQFFEGASRLCRVEVPGKNANYVRLQLKKRIDVRKLDRQIKVSVGNDIVYLEKQ